MTCLVASGLLGLSYLEKDTQQTRGHSPDAVSMLAHRLRRWPNIETASGECSVFAGHLHYVGDGWSRNYEAYTTRHWAII